MARKVYKVAKGDDSVGYVYEVQLEGLLANGWTVVEDGVSNSDHDGPDSVNAPEQDAVVQAPPAEAHSADNEE